MAKRFLLFVGSSQVQYEDSDHRDILESIFDGLEITHVSNGIQALAALGRNPTKYSIVIIDLASAGLPVSGMVTGIKEINPGLEIVLLGYPGLTWDNLELPRYQRPILLSPPVNTDTLISCLVKLFDMVEVKLDYASLSHGFKGHIALARKNIQVALALFNRLEGVGMISMRRDGFITYYNPAAHRLTGYSQDEVPHIRKWAETLLRDPASIQSILTTFNRFWIEGVSRDEMVVWIRPKSGRARRMSIAAFVLQDDKGEPRQLVLLLFDPKEKSGIQAVRALHQSYTLGIYSYYSKEGFTGISKPALDLVNRAFLLSLTTADVIGRQIHELTIPEEIAKDWQDWLEGVASGQISPDQKPPPFGLRNRRIMEHACITILEEDNVEQSGVMALVMPRRDLEIEYTRNFTHAELSHQTLMSLPYPFMLLKARRDEEGEIKKVFCLTLNASGHRLLGIEPIPLTGISLGDLWPDESAAEFIANKTLNVIETGQEDEFELTLHKNKGAPFKRNIQFWVSKAGDGAGFFFRDVTAEREEERLLRQYQHVFAHMEESIIVTNLEGNIIDWNPASERMFGYKKEEIVGKPVFLLTSDKLGEQLQQEAQTIFRDGDVWKGEYWFTRSDAHTGIANHVFAVLKDDKGRSYGTVGLSRDVTETKRMQERLTLRTRELQEKNMALNTLLRHAEEERIRACQQVVSEATNKITKGLHQILEAKSNPELVENLCRLLLKELDHSTADEDTPDLSRSLNLTEKELEVARLIRLGKTTDEIAFILDKSSDTVRLQRISIRKKLGLKSRDRNLHKHLNKLDIF